MEVRARAAGPVPLKSAAAPELWFPMKSWPSRPVCAPPAGIQTRLCEEDEPLRGVKSPADEEEEGGGNSGGWRSAQSGARAGVEERGGRRGGR